MSSGEHGSDQINWSSTLKPMQTPGERRSRTLVTGDKLPNPLLGTMTLVLLSGFFPVIIVANTPGDGFRAWGGAAVVMIIVGARFAWIVSSRDRRLFEMATWLYFYMFLGAAPLVQLRERVDPDTTPAIQHSYDGQAVAIVLISAFAIMAGSALSARRSRDLGDTQTSPIHRGRATLLALGVIAFTAIYIVRLGPRMLIASRDERGAAAVAMFPDLTASTIASALVSMGLLVSVVAQLTLNRERSAAGLERKYLLLTTTTLLLFAFVNPISMPRYVFGTVVLGYLAALGIYGTTNRFRITALSSIAGLLFLFPILDLFRRNLDARVQFENPFESLLSGDYDSFAQINNTAFYVAAEGATMGGQALGVLLFWVPRSIWPNKPVDTGILLAEHRGYGFTNLSAPLPAELFVNGGWVLLVLGMLAFGYALRRWDVSTEQALSARGVPTVLGCIVPFYLLLILRGSLLQAMASLAVILVMTWFVRGRAPLNQAAAEEGSAVQLRRQDQRSAIPDR
jgi:hypothetical protein